MGLRFRKNATMGFWYTPTLTSYAVLLDPFFPTGGMGSKIDESSFPLNKNPRTLRTVVSLYDPFPNSIRRFAPVALARARAHGFPDAKYPIITICRPNQLFEPRFGPGL